MDLEVTVTRAGLGGIDVTNYNAELMGVLEKSVDDNGGRSQIDDYARFRDAQTRMIRAVENLTRSNDPFTVTIRVEGMKKVYPPGPRLYTAGSSDEPANPEQSVPES